MELIAIDFFTFLFALGTLAIVRIPHLPGLGKDGESVLPFIDKIRECLLFLRSWPGLSLLIVIILANNFFLGFLIVLVGPMILSFTNERLLGIGQSISACGMLLSSIFISIRGIPTHHVKTLFFFLALSGFGYSLIGMRENVFTIIVFCFIFFFSLPFINACVETIIRKKVDIDMQGRVFSVIAMAAQLGLVLSFSIAGPIADKVFTPLLSKNGALADNIGKVFGTGQGRGIGLMFFIAGCIIMLITVISYSIPLVRNIDEDLPDVVQEIDAINAELSIS